MKTIITIEQSGHKCLYMYFDITMATENTGQHFCNTLFPAIVSDNNCFFTL